jgi:hypothetical protein
MRLAKSPHGTRRAPTGFYACSAASPLQAGSSCRTSLIGSNDVRQQGLEYFDQRQALEEGWCLMFSDGRGVIEIQRDDEANTFSRPFLGLRVFKYDEEAREFVAKHAAQGSRYHQHALAIIEGQLA